MKKGIRKMLSSIACTALATGCLAGCGFNFGFHPQQVQPLNQLQKMLRRQHPKLLPGRY